MAKSLVPSEFKTHTIDQIIESISEVDSTNYYSFIGDHLSQGSTIEEISDIDENVRNLNSNVFRNMIIGKKLNTSDFALLVNRHDWQSGTVFTMYDDTELNLKDKNFYTVVDEDSYKHVYKCLYNANGAPSTVKPLFQDARYDRNLYQEGDAYYETNDGYQWKYLYSIDSTTFNKFATEKYIPIVANTTIQDNANPGSIDVIRVVSGGKNYNNSLSDQFTDNDFNRITPTIATSTNIIKSNQALGDPALWYRIKNGKDIINFYKNTFLYLSSGVGAGEYRRIVRSDFVTGVGTVVKVESNFTVVPDNTTTYEIYPEVRIIGDGSETETAYARAVINANSSNSIHRIEMLDVGKNYKYASAEVLSGTADEIDGIAVDPVSAELRAILPPQGGHGANSAIELFSSRFAINSKYKRDEGGLVSAENTFTQFGIIRNPYYANVEFFYDTYSGEFLENEEIIQFKKDQLAGSWFSNTTIQSFVQRNGGSGDYSNYYTPGDRLYIRTTAGDHYVANVISGSNSTAIALDANIPFIEGALDTDIEVFNIKTIATAKIDNSNPPKIAGQPVNVLNFYAMEVEPSFEVGQIIYGQNSRSIANVVGIDINSRIGTYDAAFTFNNFNQLFKIQGTITSGVFQADERVSQLDPVTNKYSYGYIHSFVDDGNDYLYLTRVEGDFITSGATIIGSTSGAQFAPLPGDTLDIIYGDLDQNYGSIIYLQNDIPVSRDLNQTEEVRVILEF
jgi:hypothetical protein